MSYNWVFPPNGGGSFQGFNDGAIDQFKGDRIGSFVREAIQNSLDAADGSNNPVRVAFTMDKLDKAKCPELSDLLPFLENAEKIANDERHKKVFRDAATELKKAKEIRFLAIHDANTTGLHGALDKPKGPWFALTKGTGSSEKQVSGSLGSFGHGSKAPFALTKARTVFYYSQIPASDENVESEFRFQGKSILQSLDLGEGNYSQGTGFYGKTDACLPLLNDEIPSWAKDLREDLNYGVGTSVYIPMPYWNVEPGSHYDFWEQVVVCVLASFYYAIKQGLLEVQCNELVINSANVGVVFEKHGTSLDDDADLNADGIKEKLKSVQTVHKFDEKGILPSKVFGNIDYFLRFNPDVQWKKVGIARKNGMLITREPVMLKTFSKVRQFDLFLCVSNEPGSTILKELENPTHDSFSFDRIDDLQEQKIKKAKYSEFVKEVKQFLEEKVPLIVTEEIDIQDLDDLFESNTPDDSEKSKTDEASTRIKISNEKELIQKAKAPKKEGNGTGRGRGQRGGTGKKIGTGGKIPDTNGDEIVTVGWEKTAQEAQNVRVVVRDASKPWDVTVFVTSPGPQKYALELIKSGDTDAVLIALKKPSSSPDRHVVTFDGKPEGSRVALQFDLDVPVLDFAVEGILRDIS